jgi:hypothetical protein
MVYVSQRRKDKTMVDRNKPSTKMHEVVDTATYHYAVIVHCGSRNSCFAYYDAQPAQKRQGLEVRVAKR